MWPPWGWRIADCSHGGALFGVACSAVCLTRTTCYVSTTFLRPVEGKKKNCVQRQHEGISSHSAVKQNRPDGALLYSFSLTGKTVGLSHCLSAQVHG